MIEQLYYTEPETLEFAATITGISHHEGHAVLRLDRTAFYPEGGGQPPDLGTLGGLEVVDVQKRDGEILHVAVAPVDASESEGMELEKGQTVTGVVDGARRRDYMQQHTGQHIISAALVRVGGYNTVSVHLGAEYSTIEIDSGSVVEDHLTAVEDAANAVIEQALPVSAIWVHDSEIGNYPLRRPPKVKGRIRLIRVGDADCAACGGVHVGNSVAVRLVRLVGTETIRGRLRTAWKIGDRAIDHYRLTSEVVREVCEHLSAKPGDVPERVRRQEERMRESESILKRERERIHKLAADGLLSGVTPRKGRRVITAAFEGEEKDFLRGVCKTLVGTTGVAACLTNVADGQLQWTIAIAPGAGIELQGLREDLLPIIDGKGGGRPPMWQGVGNRTRAAGEFLGAFRRLSDAE